MSDERNKPGTSINFSDETWRRFFVMALLDGGACIYPAVVKQAVNCENIVVINIPSPTEIFGNQTN